MFLPFFSRGGQAWDSCQRALGQLWFSCLFCKTEAAPLQQPVGRLEIQGGGRAPNILPQKACHSPPLKSPVPPGFSQTSPQVPRAQSKCTPGAWGHCPATYSFSKHLSSPCCTRLLCPVRCSGSSRSGPSWSRQGSRPPGGVSPSTRSCWTRWAFYRSCLGCGVDSFLSARGSRAWFSTEGEFLLLR